MSQECNTPNSLTPHANYSVSTLLHEKIRIHNTGQLISIHSQETPAEDTVVKAEESKNEEKSE